MISLDKTVAMFVKENFLTLGLIVMFLKGLADISPWEWDNKVVSLIESMLSGIRRINGKDKNVEKTD